MRLFVVEILVFHEAEAFGKHKVKAKLFRVQEADAEALALR